MPKILGRPFVAQALILRRFKSKKLSNKPSNTPRPPKDPPDDPPYAPECVAHDAFEVADFARPTSFRQFTSPDEKLGPGASMDGPYKNAQFFAYHRFTFTDMVKQAIEMRDERKANSGVEAAIEVDEDPELHESDSNPKTMKKTEKNFERILANQAKEKKKKKGSPCEKNLDDMTEEELTEWCMMKEAELKQKEKNMKLKEQLKKKTFETMTEQELEEWCVLKEMELKAKNAPKPDEATKKREAELMKKCQEAAVTRKCAEQQVKKECEDAEVQKR
ncbi:hypothetical protein KR018_007970, partial [Drosophila ironensis]